MPLSKNEIKQRAVAFVDKWKDETSEDAEAKSFLDGLFDIFGIDRKRIATFEHKVKKLNERDGFIDLFWKATILVEMKSRGKDLEKAYQQAKDYLHNIPQYELPRYILVSDFFHFELYHLEEGTKHTFLITELLDNLHYFDFIAGYEQKVFKEQDPVNIKAAELLGKFHDTLEESGYKDHKLEVYLVRILFCLFAEDTGIFERQQFQFFIEERTQPDGTDLGSRLQELFQVLNTPYEERFKNLDEQLAAFHYINGKLFEEVFHIPSFDSKMRNTLLECCYLDWSKISPAIFGSMFQSVMDPTERRNLGAHYTSEKNILKLIKPLFLDELWEEFNNVKHNKNKLTQFHDKLSKLKFLDPACGCGNFLIITYRELRLLEIEILKKLYDDGQQILEISEMIKLNVDMMYGIEVEEFPARIAEVAMWLIDHQMNITVSNEFGQYLTRIPLKKSANIHNANALKLDWNEVINKNELSYIIGNPPFIGHHLQTAEQKKDMTNVLFDIKGNGVMDFVSAWFYLSSKYIQGTNIKVALVSTNSIVQGEQVGILWKTFLEKYKIYIHFAHRTFKWNNEAKGKAAVYCVIIGFANYDIKNKKIFDYPDIKGEGFEIKTKNINPYLVDAPNILIQNRTNPICNVPAMKYGNKPTDGGHFLLDDEEKNNFILNEPQSANVIKPFLSAREFLYNNKRWCIWLKDIQPDEIKKMPMILNRVEQVKKFRNESKAKSTREYVYHTLFRQITQPMNDYLIIPRTTSENRNYIPIGFFKKDVIVSDTMFSLPNATFYHFGILTSAIHMAWVKSVCGRLESRFRYSKDIVYNNYPWPENPTEKQIQTIEEKAQQVLDIRAKYPDSSLADLYDPLTMPPDLVKAHNELDKAVDKSYRSAPFTTEAERLEFLFQLYEKYTANLFTPNKNKRKKKCRNANNNITF